MYGDSISRKRSFLFGVRPLSRVAMAMLAALFAVNTQAFAVLDLPRGGPQIESSPVDVVYTGDFVTGTLTASGVANVINPPGAPLGDIANGTFNLDAVINSNTLTASGELNIGGTAPGLGYLSGTLLTGTFYVTPTPSPFEPTQVHGAFGPAPRNSLEFLFEITGGDAAELYGGVGGHTGVLLRPAGYMGSFDSDFSSGPGGAFAITFVVPAPGTLWLMLLCAVPLILRRTAARARPSGGSTS